MWQYNYNIEQELYHHGILGQRWGVRRYQNSDGSLTAAGRRHLKQLDKQDTKWANKNYKKIYKQAYDSSKDELHAYLKSEVNPYFKEVNRTYINIYNKKMSELMTKSASSLTSPSGRAVKFVAKRGEVGVHLALADQNYDMSQLKNGVWASGKIAYKKKHVSMV